MPRIVGVAAGSMAEEGGILPGEELLAINGERINDIFDYMYHASSSELELLLRGLDGSEWVLEIGKTEDEDIGLIFEDGILDKPRACGNRCIFCFIDQLPRGMRETLYFKDDDVRMSFTNGNYVSLTNVADDELRRIARYGLSPVNISVHTTDAALRALMFGATLSATPSATAPLPARQLERYDILPKIKYLTDSGIAVNAQIVLCRNYNDGAALDATLVDLGRLGPNLLSISVVPSGLTKYRSGLPHLEAYDKEAAASVLAQISRWQKTFMRTHGRRTVYAADELYITASARIPGHAAYEGYPQLENGVGMVALFKKQFGEGISSLKRCKNFSKRLENASSARLAYILTGRASVEIIGQCADRLRRLLPGLKITVVPVDNSFFGGLVTVSGLLTGIDIIKCIKKLEYQSNSCFFISKTMLRRDSELFLDDYTLESLRKLLNIDIIAVENDGRAFIKALLQGAV